MALFNGGQNIYSSSSQSAFFCRYIFSNFAFFFFCFLLFYSFSTKIYAWLFLFFYFVCMSFVSFISLYISFQFFLSFLLSFRCWFFCVCCRIYLIQYPCVAISSCGNIVNVFVHCSYVIWWIWKCLWVYWAFIAYKCVLK